MPGKNSPIVRLLLLILVTGFLFSCTGRGKNENGQVTGSDSVIPWEQLVLITADMHIAEAVLQTSTLRGEEKRFEAERLYRFIWQKYHITHGQFERNIERLKEDPEEFLRFYQEVIKTLDARKPVPARETE